MLALDFGVRIRCLESSSCTSGSGHVVSVSLPFCETSDQSNERTTGNLMMLNYALRYYIDPVKIVGQFRPAVTPNRTLIGWLVQSLGVVGVRFHL